MCNLRAQKTYHVYIEFTAFLFLYCAQLTFAIELQFGVHYVFYCYADRNTRLFILALGLVTSCIYRINEFIFSETRTLSRKHPRTRSVVPVLLIDSI